MAQVFIHVFEKSDYEDSDLIPSGSVFKQSAIEQVNNS